MTHTNGQVIQQQESEGNPGGVEQTVRDRYARGAAEFEPGLCCPEATYDPESLSHLPEEIARIDYGCGDPSKHVRVAETVLDLGSGSGKICYILAKKVGRHGRVIGVDFNDAMLTLARKHQDEVAQRLGYFNVSFHKARIQDLALDLEAVQRRLDRHPVRTIEDLAEFEHECENRRRHGTLIEDDSIDVIVSNCVLNLVKQDEKERLFREMHRVLKRGGRAVISDIVCDEDPTPEIMNDPELWSGCIAGAFREDRFLEMFEEAGFYGVEILSRGEEPWQTIDGIEFRSVTVRAFKGKEGPCLERNQAVIYKGPWKQVHDDDGHVLHRGRRMAVCDKTYQILTSPDGPYAEDMIAVPPHVEVPVEDAPPFACHGSSVRDPREIKGADYRETRLADSDACCAEDGCC